MIGEGYALELEHQTEGVKEQAARLGAGYFLQVIAKCGRATTGVPAQSRPLKARGRCGWCVRVRWDLDTPIALARTTRATFCACVFESS